MAPGPDRGADDRLGIAERLEDLHRHARPPHQRHQNREGPAIEQVEHRLRHPAQGEEVAVGAVGVAISRHHKGHLGHPFRQPSQLDRRLQIRAMVAAHEQAVVRRLDFQPGPQRLPARVLVARADGPHVTRVQDGDPREAGGPEGRLLPGVAEHHRIREGEGVEFLLLEMLPRLGMRAVQLKEHVMAGHDQGLTARPAAVSQQRGIHRILTRDEVLILEDRIKPRAHLGMVEVQAFLIAQEKIELGRGIALELRHGLRGRHGLGEGSGVADGRVLAQITDGEVLEAGVVALLQQGQGDLRAFRQQVFPEAGKTAPGARRLKRRPRIEARDPDALQSGGGPRQRRGGGRCVWQWGIHRQPVTSTERPVRSSARCATTSPIARQAVAAGLGALSTCRTPTFSTK